jgi:hypothetical protein
MFHNVKLTQPAEAALSRLQDTTLSPMEEALFQAWTHANGIEKPDAPGQNVDLRGLYKAGNGIILPNNQLKQVTDKVNASSKLQQILEDRYKMATQQLGRDRLANMDRAATPGQPLPHPVDAEQQQPEPMPQGVVGV